MGNAVLSTSPLVRTYTLEEFWALPEHKGRNKLELIAGVLYMSPPPEYTHDNVVSRLNAVLLLHLHRNQINGRLFLPRAAIWTSSRTYLEPDLFYVSAELSEKLNPTHRNCADLVVEVVSPGSELYDRNTKADTYGALGIKELWLIGETDQTVEVRYQTGNGFDSGRMFSGTEPIVSTVFPKLQLAANRLFQD